MVIGRDVYCDSRCIIKAIEGRFEGRKLGSDKEGGMEYLVENFVSSSFF
jgi:hypothetical protein